MKITKKNTINFLIIMIVFACTGLTTIYVSSAITEILGLEKWSLSYFIVWFLIILPVYHLLLLGYAFLFGKFDYFWGRIKKIKSKLVSWIN